MSRLIAILGPTASGKSDLALGLAAMLDAEILSVDSMQVYRGMDIGTAKPSPDEQKRIVHHMIDVVDPVEDYSVAEFQNVGRDAIASADARDTAVVIVGGSGLHFRALVDPLEFPASDPVVRAEVDELDETQALDELLRADPDAGAHIDLANPRRVQRAVEIARLGGPTPTARAAGDNARSVREYRPHHDFVALGLEPAEMLRSRAEKRMDKMLATGLMEEIDALQNRLGRNARQAVGYKQLLPVVRGEIDLAGGRQRAIDATVSLAKRQRTFFRRDPRINWMPWVEEPKSRLASAQEVLERTVQWIS